MIHIVQQKKHAVHMIFVLFSLLTNNMRALVTLSPFRLHLIFWCPCQRWNEWCICHGIGFGI